MPTNLAIVAGNDEFLVDREARRLFELARVEAGAEADVEIIDGLLRVVDDAPLIEARVRDALSSMGLFGTAKVVWLRNFNWLNLPKAQSGSESVTEILEEHLLPIILQVDPAVRLVISMTPISRVRTVYKKLQAGAGVFKDIPDVTAEGTLSFIQQLFREAGLKAGPGAVAALQERVLGSTRALLTECEKLAVYAGPGGTVTADDIRRITPVFGESEVFEPADAVLAGDLDWTLESLDRFFFHHGSPRPLLASLHNRIRLLLQIRALADAGVIRLTTQGVSDYEIKAAAARYGALHGEGGKVTTNLFSQNPWYVGTKIAPAAALFSLRELIDFQRDLLAVYASGDEAAAFRAACVRLLAPRRRVSA